MTDTKMVLVPLVALKDTARKVNADCDTPDIDLTWTYEKWVQASPNQGKVTPEMVESIAMKLSPFSFRDDSHVSDARDKATRDYEKRIGRKATRSTVLKVIKALGLEVAIDG